MTGSLPRAIVSAFRRTSVPLAWYYAVTLGIPIANGAASAGSAFVEHALVVLVLPPIGILIAAAVAWSAQ